MPDFTYQALDRSGNTMEGTIVARDDMDAAIKVRALGVYPTRIGSGGFSSSAQTAKPSKNGKHAAKIGKSPETAISNAGGKKVSRLHILMFTREMADLLDAGLPMDRCFSVLIDQTDVPQLQAMLIILQGDIRAGEPLSEALKRYPKEFPMLYANMVHAGEVSGQLAAVMLRLAEFMEKEQVRRSQVIAALTYPMVLVSVAILAIGFLLTFVIPKLSGVFKEMGSALPLQTRLLLATSGFLVGYWWAIIVTVAGLAYGYKLWSSTAHGRNTIDNFRLRAPMIGVLANKIVSARLVRTLGTLLGGGVPILDALEISATAVGNVVTSEAVLTARSGVRQGETLHEAMENTGAFLPVVKHMTAVGEETGRLPAMLIRTADTLDFEVDNAMRRLTSLVEPLVVLLMGGFVGFIVLSILQPIFEVNSMIK